MLIQEIIIQYPQCTRIYWVLMNKWPLVLKESAVKWKIKANERSRTVEGRAWWCMPIILALLRVRQREWKFKARLNYRVRLGVKQKRNNTAEIKLIQQNLHKIREKRASYHAQAIGKASGESFCMKWWLSFSLGEKEMLKKDKSSRCRYE